MDQLPDKILEELAEKWLNGTLTPEEETLFNQWYEQHSDEEIPVEGVSREAFRDNMLAYIKNAGREQNADQIQTHSARSTRHRQLLLMGAAAAILAIVFGLFWYLCPPGTAPDNSMILAQGIKPGGNKAVLTLGNGHTIILDTAQQGQLANQGNMTVTKAGKGLVVYQTNENAVEKEISYNTLSTPKGGKFQVILPDGTKVWLNAASSIRYPTAFIGRERKVEITGEAYFEVVHNAKMPFRVQAGKVLIEDLGTQFDVNSYDNEPNVKVSLLEGAVQVRTPETVSGKVMSPGQQARINSNGGIQVINDPHITGSVAWKDGLFDFTGFSLRDVMRQLERWYDISVVYTPGLPDYRFGGQTYMNANLSEVLKVLELNGIHFKLEKGGSHDAVKLIIMP